MATRMRDVGDHMPIGLAPALDAHLLFKHLNHVRERSDALIAMARRNSQMLAEQIAEARRQVLASRQLLLRPKPTLAPWPADDVTQQQSTTSEATEETRAAGRTFAAVTELIEQIEQSAVRDSDLVAKLIALIKRAAQGNADPSLLMGVLLEGIVHTMRERISAQDRHETVVALCTLLTGRIGQ